MQKTSASGWDRLSAFLLFLLNQIIAARVVTTDWTPLLYFTQTLAAMATALGLALGVSRFGKRTVLALAAGYTAFLVPWRLIGAVKDASFWERLTHVARIIVAALNQFVQRQPVKDPLLFILFMCLVIWLISLASGYWLTRHGSIIWTLVLGGAAIIIVQAYANYQPQGSWWLAVYFFVALLLAGRVYFLASRRDWSRRRVFISDGSWSDIFGTLFLTAAIGILAAWTIPTSAASVRSAADTWSAISRPIRERFSNAVTSLNGPYGRASGNFYGSALPLGQSAVSGDSVVFKVEVLSAPSPAPRFYWRGRVFDLYESGRWSNAPASNLQFEPQQGDLAISDLSGRSEELLKVTNEFTTQSLIYAPSPVVWLNQPASIVARDTGASSYDALSWEATDALPAGGTYEVKAEISDPGVDQVRSAGTTYPSWITDHYLQVPANLRSDLRTLAEATTSGQSNAYDKAVAITNNLRANLQYSTSVPAAPAGHDPVMWVLQDYKKGFCNYYASAEVLLLRSIGIPARLAVGFAQGELQDGSFIVRSHDAHAWPEVYFPGIGWLEFEPTVNQLPLLRPGELQSNGLPFVEPRERPVLREQGSGLAAIGSAGTSRPTPFTETAQGRAILISAATVMVALFIAFGSRRGLFRRLPIFMTRALASSGISTPIWIQNWARWNRLEPVERSFSSVTWSLQWLGKPPTLDATPAERAHALTVLLPSAAQHIEALSAELESGLFTPQPANLSRAWRASLIILIHSIRARLMRVISGADGRDVYFGQNH